MHKKVRKKILKEAKIIEEKNWLTESKKKRRNRKWGKRRMHECIQKSGG